MSEADRSLVLLTLDDAIKLRSDRDVLVRDIERMSTELESINRKLEVITSFVSDEVRARIFDDDTSTSDESEVNRPHSKWKQIVVPLLQKTGHGLTTGDFKKLFTGTETEDQLGLHGSALYNGLSKLVHKGTLEKIGDFYCLPGQSPGNLQKNDSTAANQIEVEAIKILRDYPRGLQSGKIIDMLLGGAIADVIKSSPNYPYTVFSKLARQGILVRNGSIYSLPAEENEPSDAGASNGSDAGSDDGGRPRALRLV